MERLFHQLLQTLESGKSAVLVTLVASSGSTPRRMGARMLVTGQEQPVGSIGGGAVEYRCQQIARELLEAGGSRLEFFQLRENQVQDLGMICGGDVHVHFRCLSPDEHTLTLARTIDHFFKQGEQCWLITEVTANRMGALAVYGVKSGLAGDGVPQEVLDHLNGRSGQVQAEGRTFHCETLIQAGRVFIFGGGHVTQSLVPALSAIEFRCIVLEDRKEFCNPALFPGVWETRLVDINDPEVYRDITADDYVCIMTRGHKDDLAVQARVLKTQARYIGVIGSRRKAAAIAARLKEMGCTDEELSRITTPIGLDIQAETPAEIAVSIAAQMLQLRAKFKRKE